MSRRWRNQIRKALSPTEKVASTAADAKGEKEEDQDEDEKELNEMEEKTSEAKRKKERAKKRLAERLAKVSHYVITQHMHMHTYTCLYILPTISLLSIYNCH